MAHLEFLELNDMRVLKIIRIIGPQWNHFIGNVYYRRPLTREYNSNTPDFVDDGIFKVITELYPDAKLEGNVNLFYKGQFEDIAKNFGGNHSTKLNISFFPLIDPNEILKHLGKRYSPYNVKLGIQLSIEEDKVQYLREFGICYYPIDNLDKVEGLVNSIQI